MASPSSSPTPTGWDVFLSFRGIDTRTGFTSHLYNSLHRTGIRTFIDEPELRAGDVIKLELHNAIKQSKLYIVVMSENYASSVWCLDELAEILERWKSSGRLVLPIFYKIQPSVVRHQLWQFGEAFGKYEGRFPREIVNKWRASLKEVADISGYHVTRHFRTEAEIIDEVVDRVLLEINPGTMYVAKYPVGIDSSVAKIKSLLDSGNTIDGVHWIGIYGMGGIGKTTLAKAFYNQMIHNYEGSSFLSDIKDCVASSGLVSLQQQLIDDVLKRKNATTISSIDRGINLIRERICSLKVLVVLDDLDHRNQVDSLVGKFLASGSVIVLTTRNADLLDAIKVEARHKVAALGVAESRKLFMKHAFGDAKIKEEFKGMSEEILSDAGGLPLAITVLGSNLFEQSEKRWKWFINRLKRLPIDTAVEEKLKVSFDGLVSVDRELQDVFLDIACFFVGRTKDYAVERLETCYESIDHYISVLNKRSLITINENNQLWMHDLLQGMGRNIAGNSRLIAREDVRDMLESNKGTEAIEGMVHSDRGDNEPYSCDVKTFDRMPKLRFLSLYKVNMRGSFGKAFKDLTWLNWQGCDSFPSNFCATKLVILELPGNGVCRFAKNALVLGKLKILDLSGSFELSKTPDFNGLPCLETLHLNYCKSLAEVDISIANLDRLATLDLCFCERLKSLPESVCKLRALKSLNLRGCKSLVEVDVSIGNLERLVTLDLSYCKRLTSLPESIGKLRALKSLDLTGCESLVEVDVSIGNLERLATLDMSYCKLLTSLPESICKLRALITLNLIGCESLVEVDVSIGNLERLATLDLSYCKRLTSLPESICKLRALESLNLTYCSSLKALPMDFGNIESLTLLYATHLRISQLPDSLGRLSKLCKVGFSRKQISSKYSRLQLQPEITRKSRH